VSISSGGVQGDNHSIESSISADGRFVAFESHATTLIAGDTNGVRDVFVRDRKLHKTRRVSISTGGVQGDGDSFESSISADGRFLAFRSDATTLVSGDTNGVTDVFVRDRKLHKTHRVSISTGGVQGDGDSISSSISADGRFVAFGSEATTLVSGDTNGVTDVFVRDRKLHKTRRVSISTGGVQGDNDSISSSISTDGRFVAFESDATALVAGDTNGVADVFVRGPLR
jgi:Tol biopolymer transport system component